MISLAGLSALGGYPQAYDAATKAYMDALTQKMNYQTAQANFQALNAAPPQMPPTIYPGATAMPTMLQSAAPAPAPAPAPQAVSTDPYAAYYAGNPSPFAPAPAPARTAATAGLTTANPFGGATTNPPAAAPSSGVASPAGGTAATPQDLAAVAANEGSDYSTVTQEPDGSTSYGKYQVNVNPKAGFDNVGDWTQQYYGQRLTPQQFLANPQAQEAVAQGQLSAYKQQYGQQGMFAAWNGGPEMGAQPNNPAVAQYVQKGMTALGGVQGGQGPQNLAAMAGAQPNVSVRAPGASEGTYLTGSGPAGTPTWAEAYAAIKAANPRLSLGALNIATDSYMKNVTTALDEQIKAANAGLPPGNIGSGNYTGGNVGSGATLNGIYYTPQVVQYGQNIMDGSVSPMMTRAGIPTKEAAQITNYLGANKFDLAQAQNEWTAIQKYLSTVNGPTQQRNRAAIETANSSLDLLQSLVNQWDAGRFPALNAAVLKAAEEGVFPDGTAASSQAQNLARSLDAQLQDLAGVLGTAIMSGNTPTDQAMRRAQDQIGNASWGRDTLDTLITQVHQNLSYRLQALNNLMPVGTTGTINYGAGTSSAAPGPLDGGPTSQPNDTLKTLQDGTVYRAVNGRWVQQQ